MLTLSVLRGTVSDALLKDASMTMVGKLLLQLDRGL